MQEMTGERVTLTDDLLVLGMNGDGTGVTVEDRARRTIWRLDEDTRKVYGEADQAKYQGYTLEAEG